MKKVICMAITLAMCGLLVSCKSDDTKLGDDPVHVEMSVQDFGVIELELYPDIAPITVENFVSLVKDEFYDGLTFHRIVSGFMIQGGDPKGNGSGGSDKEIKGEFAINGVENTLSHTRGVISMARSKDPNSASSQFFIMHADNKGLDGQYAAFGKVTEGMDVVDKIASVAVETAYPGAKEKSSPVDSVYI